MHPLIANNRQQIALVCQRFGVRRLEVFGSILRSDFDPTASDVDVVVEFEPDLTGSALRRYFDLKAELERVFGRPVDIIELDAMAGTRLKSIIEKSKVAVYAAPG